MKELASKIALLMGSVLVVICAGLLSNPSYAETGSTKANFVPAKRSMSFIEFMSIPENRGIRDMRSLKKRYARYRNGRFLASDDTPSVGGETNIPKKG